MRLVFFVLVLAAVAGAGRPAAADGPPLTDGWYVDEGACPFEGCTYRDWTVEADTVLYSRPWSARSAGTARAGGSVKGLTGIVYTRPVPIEVAHSIDYETYEMNVGLVTLNLVPGQTIYLLTYQGESFYLAWFKGRLLSLEPSAGMMTELPDDGWGVSNCRPPTASCWWQVPPGRQRYESVWWAQIQLPDGTRGWTRQLRNFGNIDALE